MTDDDLRTTDALLDAALDLAPSERAAYLEAHAPPPLRAYLGSLLDAAEADDPLLDDAPVSLVELQSAIGADGPTGTGEVVGPYWITGLLGEGGMGRVYRAERADGAFEREVALKLVRRSLTLAGADVAERLRREREVLATLDHPNIARLYGGGETDDGVPWVAMELVEGQPITAYADARDLDVRGRVALAVDVCRAVEHAHRRLVVHRDLKPSNVFVAEDEAGAPVVKLLDFGIARLLDVDAEGLTRTGSPVLTPEYAAPEQLRHGEITTATDVWALGVLLYEVLAGRRPYALPAAEGAQGTLGRLRELERALQDPPARPSEAAPADRARPLRGDLDAILLQALRPEPERRYASAGALGDDLARHLEGRPVLARPESRWYHTRAFVRRNRGAVAAGLAVAVSLVVGLAAALLALDRERDAHAMAEAEIDRADAAFEFVVDLFGGSHGATLHPDVTAGDLLEAGFRRAQSIPEGHAAERAVAFGALREVHGRLDQNEAARRAAAEAARAARLAYGAGHPHALHAIGELAIWTTKAEGPDRAYPLIEQATKGYQAHGHDGRLPLARLLAEFGAAAAWAGYHDDDTEWARSVALRALDDAEPVLRTEGDSLGLLGLLNGRGHLADMTEGPAASAPSYEEAFVIARALFGEGRATLSAMNNWGDILTLAGRAEEAVPVLDSLVARSLRHLGPDHPASMLALVNASFARLDRDHPGDVARALDWTARADTAQMGIGSWAASATAARLVALRAARRWAELDRRAARAVVAFEAVGDAEGAAAARAEQAYARLALGDTALASALARTALRDASGEPAAIAQVTLGCIARGWNDAGLATASFAAARAALTEVDHPPHYRTSKIVRAGPAGGACDG